MESQIDTYFTIHSVPIARSALRSTSHQGIILKYSTYNKWHNVNRIFNCVCVSWAVLTCVCTRPKLLYYISMLTFFRAVRNRSSFFGRAKRGRCCCESNVNIIVGLALFTASDTYMLHFAQKAHSTHPLWKVESKFARKFVRRRRKKKRLSAGYTCTMVASNWLSNGLTEFDARCDHISSTECTQGSSVVCRRNVRKTDSSFVSIGRVSAKKMCSQMRRAYGETGRNRRRSSCTYLFVAWILECKYDKYVYTHDSNARRK